MSDHTPATANIRLDRSKEELGDASMDAEGVETHKSPVKKGKKRKTPEELAERRREMQSAQDATSYVPTAFRPRPKDTPAMRITPSTVSPSPGAPEHRQERNPDFPLTAEYEEVRQLGQGGNGRCILVRHRAQDFLRACKVCRAYPPTNEYHLPNEIRFLREFLPEHERIIRLHQFNVTTRAIDMYFDYCESGDIGRLIRMHQNQKQEFTAKFTENFIWHVYQQLTEAVAYIHTGYDALTHRFAKPRSGHRWKPIIHGDIKPANVFLRPSKNQDGFPDLVLGDFGNSKTSPGVGTIGTYLWVGPEIGLGRYEGSYSVKSDVWGVGAVIHALCHGGPPLLPLPPLPLDKPPRSNPDIKNALYYWHHDPRARGCTPLGPEYSQMLRDCLGINLHIANRPKSIVLLGRVKRSHQLRVLSHEGDWSTIAVDVASTTEGDDAQVSHEYHDAVENHDQGQIPRPSSPYGAHRSQNIGGRAEGVLKHRPFYQTKNRRSAHLKPYIPQSMRRRRKSHENPGQAVALPKVQPTQIDLPRNNAMLNLQSPDLRIRLSNNDSVTSIVSRPRENVKKQPKPKVPMQNERRPKKITLKLGPRPSPQESVDDDPPTLAALTSNFAALDSSGDSIPGNVDEDPPDLTALRKPPPLPPRRQHKPSLAHPKKRTFSDFASDENPPLVPKQELAAPANRNIETFPYPGFAEGPLGQHFGSKEAFDVRYPLPPPPSPFPIYRFLSRLTCSSAAHRRGRLL